RRRMVACEFLYIRRHILEVASSDCLREILEPASNAPGHARELTLLALIEIVCRPADGRDHVHEARFCYLLLTGQHLLSLSLNVRSDVLGLTLNSLAYA